MKSHISSVGLALIAVLSACQQRTPSGSEEICSSGEQITGQTDSGQADRLDDVAYCTEPGELKLMPAWFEEFPDGALEGERLAGGHTMDLTWRAGVPVEAVIHAVRTESLTVHYQGRQTVVELQAGQTARLRFSGCPPQQGGSQTHPAPFR